MRLFLLVRYLYMKLVTLVVEGMHCSMCESHICDCIRKGLPSAKKIKANHKDGKVCFIIEDDDNYSKCIDNIKNDGYKVLSSNIEDYVKKGFFSSIFKK